MPKVAVVLGTRPEIIKLAGVLDELGDRAVFIHTGQHYDPTLSGVFLDGLGLRPPDVALSIGGLSRAEQIGRAVTEVSAALARERADVVLVQGDTNSALAGGLAANCLTLPLVHVEAGLRSYDRAMPEEHNRVLVDHLADLLAAPTAAAAANLAREGINSDAVVVTGNTVVEAVARQLPDPAARRALRARLGVPDHFVVATIHRPENTDDPARLAEILQQLADLPVRVILPLHPRTAAAIERAGLGRLLAALHVVEPLDGPGFLGLAADAALLVSDSGGVQEETTLLGRPLLVVRRSTERPEAHEFAQLVEPAMIGPAAKRLLRDLAAVHARLAATPSPFGDGLASSRIVALIDERFGTAALNAGHEDIGA